MRALLLGLITILFSNLANAQSLYTFNGGGTTGNWNDSNVWTTDPTGSTSVGARVPTNGDNVVVTNSYLLLLDNAVAATSLSVTIQRGGVLDLTTNAAGFSNPLTRLAGQGTLRIARPFFPTVTTNDFDDANTGTVEFYNWGTTPATLPQPLSGQYNNLRLINTTASNTAYTARIDGNLTIKGSLTLLNANFVPTNPVTFPASTVILNLGLTAGISRTLTVDGNITVGGGTTLGVTAANGTHTLTVKGNLINNGKLNLHVTDAQNALLSFTGAEDANFACNGPTDLSRLQVNKGVNSQVLLNITSTVNPSNALGNLRLNSGVGGYLLDIVNGITKLGGNIFLPSIYNGNNVDFNLGSDTSNPTLWIAGATVQNNNIATLAIYGKLRVSAGELQVLGNRGLILQDEGEILMEGGTVNTETFKPFNSPNTPRGSFTITGGLFNCSGTANSNTLSARFSLPYPSQSFRMTGGTIRLSNSDNNAGTYHIGVDPNNALITGGTVEVIMPNSGADCKILSTVPVWNLTISKALAGGGVARLDDIGLQAAKAEAVLTRKPLTVLNNFTITGPGGTPTDANKAIFDAFDQNLTIEGTFNIGANGIYLPRTNTTTFSGGQNQLLTCNGKINNLTTANTFHNWVVNKPAGTLTLGGTATVYTVAQTGVLSLLRGVLNDGGKNVNVLGNMVNSASHTSGGLNGSITLAGAAAHTVSGDGTGVFGNLRVNSTAGDGTVAATMTANMSVASILTFQSLHILAIGSNRLSLTNVLNSAVSGTFSNQCFIQTAGNQSDLGLQKTWGGNASFTFPVGVSTKYTPATIDLFTASALTQYGQVSVSPTNMRSPFATGADNALRYYWKVRSVGFLGIPSGSITGSFQMKDADGSGVLDNYVPARYLPVSWTIGSGSVLSGPGFVRNISFPMLDQFEGEFTAGEISAFGDVTAYYSITNGNWHTAATWKSVTGNVTTSPAAAAPGAGNPVFIGSASTGVFHTVNVAANNASAGSLVIDRGSVLDVQTTTGHNFGALPDAKVGGSGTLRVSSSVATAVFPGGDFGTFLQPGGGTVEYYTTGAVNFTVPTASASGLTLSSYRNLWVSAGAGRTITLPNQNLRVFAQLKTGATTGFNGIALLSGAANGNLRVDSLLAVERGTFRYANGTARSIVADTDVRVDASATFDADGAGAAVANALSVGGSLTNNGVLNFNTATAKLANLTFTGAQNASFTGPTATTTALRTLTLNKGATQAPTLTVNMAGTLTTPTNSWLTLINGTLRYAKPSSTLVIHDAASSYFITDNAGLTVEADGAIVTVATNTSVESDLELAGQVQVIQGTLNVGTGAGLGNDLEYASAGNPTLRVSPAGTLFVNGQVRRSLSNTNGSLRYVQSGGSTEVAGFGATNLQSEDRGLFEVQGVGSIFRMTGGTLTLRRSNGQPLVVSDLYLRPDSTLVTAGKVVLGNAASGAGNVTVSVSSSVPLFDLQVEAGANNTSTNTGLITALLPLNLKGSLTIGNDNAFFNANGIDVNIDRNLVNNNSSTNNGLNNGGFRPATTDQTTTFTGRGPALQELTSTAANLTVFGNLVLNNTQANGTLQLGRNALVAGTLTLTKGTLADNGQTITVLGNVVNSAVHTSAGSGSLTLAGTVNQTIGGNGTGRFGNVILNNANGANTLANQEITGVLTLTNGVLNIGSNLLWLSNPSAGAVAGSFGVTRAIQTNGIVADLGVQKSYPVGASNFTFPVGVANKYTPVQMNVTSNSAVGTITVRPIDRSHPSTTDPAARELRHFWKVSSTGFSAPTVNQVFTYMDADVSGTEAAYTLGRFLNGAWTPQGGIPTSTVNTTANTLTNNNANYFEGDYTGGEPSEFGNVPTFYSRNATAGQPAGANWDAPATPASNAWTFNSDGTDSPSLPTTFPTLANPVVIRSGHLINSNGSGRGAANLLLLGTLDVSTFGANNFGTVTGTGTLRIGSALFPAGNYAQFVAPVTGGTVDYSGPVQLPARDTYNNLLFSGANTKQLSNLDLTVNGFLTVNANTTVNNPTGQSIRLTSATSGATLNGTFNLSDGNLTTGAFLANTGTLSLGAGTVSIGTTLNNSGTVNNGDGPVTVGTDLTNTGIYKANVGTGTLQVGNSFINSGTYTAGFGVLKVEGTLTTSTGSTFTAAVGDVNVTGNFANGGAYTATMGNVLRVTGDFSNSGIFDAGNLPEFSTVILRGNFTNTNSFEPGNSLAQFLTDANRTLTGSTTFNNLQKFGTSVLFLGNATDITVSNILTMQAGVILTGTANTVRLTNTSTQPIVGNSTATYIAGRLAISLPNTAGSIRVFPVGLGGRYRPVTIQHAASTNPVVVIEIFNAPPLGARDPSLANLSANRYYRIQLLSGTIVQPTVQLSFNTDVIDERVFVPGNLRVARSNGNAGPWSTAGGAGVFSPAAPRGFTISAPTSITSNSFFALGSTNATDNPLTNPDPTPLPVELLKFTATPKGSVVNLAWTTASEKNSSHFMVQRSANGTSFENIGRVLAKGNSTSVTNYASLDASPLNGLNYYRLHQVDTDGTSAYSPVVMVRFERKGAAPALVAYPNPVSGQEFQLLTTNLNTTGGTVQVFDNVGRLVLTHVAAAGAVETTVRPAQPLVSGMYLVTWQAANGVKLTTKVVVQ